MKTIALTTGLPEGSNLNLHLGISDERAEVIDQHLNATIAEANKTQPLMAKVLADAGSVAENDNELLYVSFAIGHHIGQIQADPLAGLRAMLAGGENDDEEVNQNNLETEG